MGILFRLVFGGIHTLFRVVSLCHLAFSKRQEEFENSGHNIPFPELTELKNFINVSCLLAGYHVVLYVEFDRP